MLNLNMTIDLSLQPAEFTLIRAALRGQLKSPEAAARLEAELVQSYIAQVRHRARETEKLAMNVERATGFEPV